MIDFDEEEPITGTDNDKIITNLAIKATSESLEDDIFDFNGEKYAWVWYDSITMDEWGMYERYATFPQE